MKHTAIRIFHNIDQEKIVAMRARGTKNGIDLSVVSGEFQYDLCEVTYIYDAENRTLELSAHLPFFVGEGGLWNALQDALGLPAE